MALEAIIFWQRYAHSHIAYKLGFVFCVASDAFHCVELFKAIGVSWVSEFFDGVAIIRDFELIFMTTQAGFLDGVFICKAIPMTSVTRELDLMVAAGGFAYKEV